MGNRIANIDWRGGGNGQNGNGISIYLADDVIVSDNQISDCAFSAVRINGGKNCQIRGNSCSSLGETAIYAEFGFSGSVIADNVVDGAATGISITNLGDDGAVQLELPFDRTALTSLDLALDDVKERFGSSAVTRAVHLGKDLGWSVPLLPD